MSVHSEKVVGRIPVLECLRAAKRKARRLFVLKDAKGIGDILSASAKMEVRECSRRELDTLSGGVTHQGVILEADPLPVLNAKAWLNSSFPKDTIVVILDGVEDPHNFGAIVRSAAAFGASAVVFGKDRSAPISSVSMKSAAGAMEYIDLVEATNLVQVIESLKKTDFWIAALDSSSAQTLWQADLRGQIALVVGSEGKGIRRLVRERCDFHLQIPLTGPITSLNASVSAAVVLAECVRQRSSS